MWVKCLQPLKGGFRARATNYNPVVVEPFFLGSSQPHASNLGVTIREALLLHNDGAAQNSPPCQMHHCFYLQRPPAVSTWYYYSPPSTYKYYPGHQHLTSAQFKKGSSSCPPDEDWRARTFFLLLLNSLLWPNMNVIFGTCSFGCTMCHARIKKNSAERKLLCYSDKSHFKAYHYLAAAVGHHGVSHDKVYVYQLKIESGYSFVEAPFGKRGHLLRHGWCQGKAKSNSAYRKLYLKSNFWVISTPGLL